VFRLLQAVFPCCAGRLAALTACQAVTAAAEAAIVALMVPLLASVAAVSGKAASFDLGLTRFAPWHPAHVSFATVAVCLIAAFLIRIAAQAGAVVLWSAGVERFETFHRARLLGGLLSASHACQSREPSGRLQHLLTHHAEAVARSFTALAWGGAHCVQVACLCLLACYVSPLPTLLSAAALAAIVALLRPLTKLVSAAAKRRAAALADYVHRIGQSAALLKELRIYGAVATYSACAAADSASIARERRKQNVVGSLLPTLYQTAAGLLLLAGATLVYFHGDLAGAAPVVSLLLLLRAASAAQHLHAMYHQLQDARPALEEIVALEKTYEREQVPSGGLALARIDRLELRNVDFAYEAGRLVLSEVGLQVERGDVVGVVGASGAGKSTLIQILLGLRTPDRGSMLINGNAAQFFRQSDLHERSAFVAQEPAFFNETIADCIRFGRPDVTDAEIEFVAAEAGLTDEIERMPHGFATRVGERGASLSLGQRQRLSIARALVGRPDLLIFDEPTAALDAETEERIVATLASLRGRAITFVVTHRPALLRACNKVLRVVDGTVVVEVPSQLREPAAA